MKPFILKSFLMCLMAMLGAKASAYDCVVDGIYYNLNETKGTASVTSGDNGNSYSGQVDIPSTVTWSGREYAVTGIGDLAFNDSKGLAGITIPNSVTHLGFSPFENCPNLTSIIIGDGVSRFDMSTFRGCPGLITLVVGDGLVTIGADAFYNLEALTNLTLGKNLKTIEAHAFGHCTNLKSVVLPPSVTSIGMCAFASCSNLTSINIPENVTILEDQVFQECSMLDNIIIPDGVTSIGSMAFMGCKGLTSVTIPKSVKEVGFEAFGYCSSLKSAVINTSILGESAFKGCSSLASLTIGENLEKMPDNTFAGCSNLEKIVVDPANTVFDSRDNCNAIIQTSTGILLIGCKNTVVPSTIQALSEMAFFDCKGLTSIVIPKNVTSIVQGHMNGHRVGLFYGCTNLEEIVVEEGNPKFDSRDGCNAIIETGKNQLLAGCKSTVIPNTVVTIGDYAFYGCRSLASIRIPNSVETIGYFAFYGCTGCVFFCDRPKPPVAESSSFTDYTPAIAIVPEEYVEAYRNSTGWRNLVYNTSLINVKATQTTAQLTFHKDFSDNWVEVDNKVYKASSDTLVIEGLSPNKNYSLTVHTTYNDREFVTVKDITTKTVSLGVELKGFTNVTVTLKGTITNGDAVVKSSGFYTEDNKFIEGDVVKIEGLEPGRKYTFTYYVKTTDGSRFTREITAQTIGITPSYDTYGVRRPTSYQIQVSMGLIDATLIDYGFEGQPNQLIATWTGLEPQTTYTKLFYYETKEGGRATKEVRFTTEPLTLSTQAPKIVAPGQVIAVAKTNIGPEEANVGFEWRRTDWSDDVASITSEAFIYEDMMEGPISIKDLETEWKYRPYYVSGSGKYHYGWWEELLPSEDSYYSPNVHTSRTVSLDGNRASVQGYAMAGTDEVKRQGFLYWKKPATAYAEGSRPALVPDDAMAADAEGYMMTAELDNLDYSECYWVVAFVEATNGKYYYGELRKFQTGANPVGVDELVSSPSAASEEARYNIQGHRIQSPEKGLNIIRMSDGTVKKVLVR